MESFPKKVFAVIEHDREPEDDFIVVNENLQNVPVNDEPTDVAIYELVEVVKVENVNRLVEN